MCCGRAVLESKTSSRLPTGVLGDPSRLTPQHISRYELRNHEPCRYQIRFLQPRRFLHHRFKSSPPYGSTKQQHLAEISPTPPRKKNLHTAQHIVFANPRAHSSIKPLVSGFSPAFLSYYIVSQRYTISEFISSDTAHRNQEQAQKLFWKALHQECSRAWCIIHVHCE